MRIRRLLTILAALFLLTGVLPPVLAGAPACRTLCISYGDDALVGDFREAAYSNNAAAVAKALSMAGEPARQIVNPNRTELLAALRQTFADAPRDGVSYIYYSGPCDTFDGKTSFLTLPDDSGTALDAISPDEFYSALSDLPGRFVVILDCPFSGGFLPQRPAAPAQNAVALDEGIGAGTAGTIDPRRAKVSVLYGCSADEDAVTAADRDGVEMGVFTRCLLYACEHGLLDRKGLAAAAAVLKRESMTGCVGWYGDGGLPLWQGMTSQSAKSMEISDASAQGLRIRLEGIDPGSAQYEIFPKEYFITGLFSETLGGKAVARGTVSVGTDVVSLSLSRALTKGNYILRLSLADGTLLQDQFAVLPEGDPGAVRLSVQETFCPGGGNRLTIAVDYPGRQDGISPLSLGVAVKNAAGETVSVMEGSEPAGYRLNGKTGRLIAQSLYFFDGLDEKGDPLPEGEYTLCCTYRFRQNGQDHTKTLERRVRFFHCSITLTVVGRYGEPEPHAEVLVDGYPMGETDGNGTIALKLPPGRYELTVRPEGKEMKHARLNAASAGALRLALYDGTATLRSLSVCGAEEELLSGFDPLVQEYRLVVQEQVEALEIRGEATHEKAVVFGVGTLPLGKPGEQTELNLMVVAEDGTRGYYRIYVLRMPEEVDVSEEEEAGPLREKGKKDARAAERDPMEFLLRKYPHGMPVSLLPFQGKAVPALSLLDYAGMTPAELLRALRWRPGMVLRETAPGVYWAIPPRVLFSRLCLEDTLPVPERMPCPVRLYCTDGRELSGEVCLNQAAAITGAVLRHGDDGLLLDYWLDRESLLWIEACVGGRWVGIRQKAAAGTEGCCYLPVALVTENGREAVTAIRLRVPMPLGPDRCRTLAVP